jgi:hypothetical protein
VFFTLAERNEYLIFPARKPKAARALQAHAASRKAVPATFSKRLQGYMTGAMLLTISAAKPQRDLSFLIDNKIYYNV